MIETLEEWLEKQNVVQVNAIKVGEEDRFILTVGEYNISPIEFETQEEAKEFLKENFKFNNFELTIIGAMCIQLSRLEEQMLNSKKTKK